MWCSTSRSSNMDNMLCVCALKPVIVLKYHQGSTISGSLHRVKNLVAGSQSVNILYFNVHLSSSSRPIHCKVRAGNKPHRICPRLLLGSSFSFVQIPSLLRPFISIVLTRVYCSLSFIYTPPPFSPSCPTKNRNAIVVRQLRIVWLMQCKTPC